MLDQIERAARLSVTRAMGFAGLAIATFMVGMSASPTLCFKSGGILVLLTCAILLLKATWVPSQPYKQTEVWLMLRKEDRPTAETAQQLITGVLRDIYLHFAARTAFLASVLFAVAFVLALSGASIE